MTEKIYVYIVWCIPEDENCKDGHISFQVGIYTTMSEAQNACQICTYKIDGVHWRSNIKKKFNKDELLYKYIFGTSTSVLTENKPSMKSSISV